MTKILNLIGAPGAGKSTLAGGLFYELKIAGIKTEYVQEMAKSLTWSERHYDLSAQPYILGKSGRNLEVLLGKVDIIISDGPLILGLYYSQRQENHIPSFSQFCIDYFKSFNNVNYFVHRSVENEYKTDGRRQTEEEANIVGEEMRQMLIDANIKFKDVTSGPNLAKEIAAEIIQSINK